MAIGIPSGAGCPSSPAIAPRGVELTEPADQARSWGHERNLAMYSVQYPTGDARAGADVSYRHPSKRFWIFFTVLSLAASIGIGFALVDPVQAASNKVIQYQIQRKQQQRFQQQFGRPSIRSNPSGQKPRYMQQFGPPAKAPPTSLPRPAPTGQQPDLSSLNRQNELRRCTAACQGQSRICAFGDTTCSSMSFGAVSACVQGCYQRIPRY